MVPHLRASRILPLAALLAAGCTLGSVEPPGPIEWDGAVEAGSGGSGSGGSSSSGGGSSSGFSGDASACQPGSLATYQPKYHPASGAGQGACTTSAISAFYDACLGASKSTDQCNTFRQTQAACVACILSPETAAKYGPLVDHGNFVTANVAGCIELLDPGALSCAKAVQALAGCELAACETNCAVHDTASLTDYESCATQVDGAGCQSYATAAGCALAEPDAAPPTSACLGDFQSFYGAVVPLFCGPPPAGAADAGGPKPLDASGD